MTSEKLTHTILLVSKIKWCKKKNLQWHGEWQSVEMLGPEDGGALQIKKKYGAVFAGRMDHI